MTSEHDLLRRTLAGDGAAIDTIIGRHLPGLRAFVRLRINAFLREREEADDVVQSVCRELLSHLGDFHYEGETRFRNWLYVAALNKLRDKEKYYRAKRRDPARERRRSGTAADESLVLAYSTVMTPSRQAMAREEIDMLEAAFDRLPDDYREVITLSRFVGLSQTEMAEQMGRTVASVRNLLTRALVKLSAELEVLDRAQGEG